MCCFRSHLWVSLKFITVGVRRGRTGLKCALNKWVRSPGEVKPGEGSGWETERGWSLWQAAGERRATTPLQQQRRFVSAEDKAPGVWSCLGVFEEPALSEDQRQTDVLFSGE